MKVIHESLDNFKAIEPATPVIDPIMQIAVKEDEEAWKDCEEMIDPVKRANERPFLGTTTKDTPKEVSMPKVTLDESLFEDYLSEEKAFTLQSKVRDYVEANYPEEYQLDFILPDITFAEVIKGMKQGKDFYELCSVNGEGFDSAVREEIFTGLEEVSHKPYEYFYQLWLHGPKNEEYDPKEEDKAEAEGAAVGTAVGVVAAQAIPGPVDDIALGALGGAVGGVGGKHLYRRASGFYDKDKYKEMLGEAINSPVANEFLDLCEEGLLSWKDACIMCLKYLSDDEIEDMMRMDDPDLFEGEDIEEESLNEAGEKNLSDVEGTISNILVANKDKINSASSKEELMKVINDLLKDHMNDKAKLFIANLEKKNHLKALQYVYDFILAGDHNKVQK